MIKARWKFNSVAAFNYRWQQSLHPRNHRNWPEQLYQDHGGQSCEGQQPRKQGEWKKVLCCGWAWRAKSKMSNKVCGWSGFCLYMGTKLFSVCLQNNQFQYEKLYILETWQSTARKYFLKSGKSLVILRSFWD